jgi:hypothetical protein
MVFCTLEMGIFGLISKGHLIVWIRQIKSENEYLFENLFSPRNFELQIQILWTNYFKPEKSALFLQMWNLQHLLSNFCENVRNRGGPFSSRGDRGDKGDSGTPGCIKEMQ